MNSFKELWVMGYELWVMGYGLRVMSYGLRVMSYELVMSRVKYSLTSTTISL